MTLSTDKRPRGRPPQIDAAAALAAMESGEKVADIAARLNVDPSSIYRAADRALLRRLIRRPTLTAAA